MVIVPLHPCSIPGCGLPFGHIGPCSVEDRPLV